MILSDLKDFMLEHRVVSIEDLIIHLDTDPDTIREMLEVWIRKGKVRKIEDMEKICHKCPQCQMMAGEFYEWIE